MRESIENYLARRAKRKALERDARMAKHRAELWRAVTAPREPAVVEREYRRMERIARRAVRELADG